VDEREQRQFIRFLAKQWKDSSRELMVYQLFVHTLKQGPLPGAEEFLDAARRSPLIQKEFENQFEGLEEMLPPADQDYADQVKELLERWKPRRVLPN
jgi:hypothetical protein